MRLATFTASLPPAGGVVLLLHLLLVWPLQAQFHQFRHRARLAERAARAEAAVHKEERRAPEHAAAGGRFTVSAGSILTVDIAGRITSITTGSLAGSRGNVSQPADTIGSMFLRAPPRCPFVVRSRP